MKKRSIILVIDNTAKDLTVEQPLFLTVKKGGNNMTGKSLADYQKEYERIIFFDQPKKDILLAGLKTEMEKQFKLPMRSMEWKKENQKVIAMYRKICITRTL